MLIASVDYATALSTLRLASSTITRKRDRGVGLVELVKPNTHKHYRQSQSTCYWRSLSLHREIQRNNHPALVGLRVSYYRDLLGEGWMIIFL